VPTQHAELLQPIREHQPPRESRDRCLWHAGGTAEEKTMPHLAATAPQLAQRVRPIRSDHRLVGKGCRPAAAMGLEDSNSTSPVSAMRGQGAVGSATYGFGERLVSTPVPCCPRSAADPARTERGSGPSGRGRLSRSGPPRPRAHRAAGTARPIGALL
jgi:hypothetical protein